MKNATQFLETKADGLRRKATENKALCGLFLALCYHTITRAHELGFDYKGVSIGKGTMNGNQIVFPIHYSPIAAPDARNIFAPQREIRDFLAAKNAHLVKALDTNPTYLNWLQEMVEIMEKWAAARGRRYELIQFDQPRIHLASDAAVITLIAGETL